MDPTKTREQRWDLLISFKNSLIRGELKTVLTNIINKVST
jgi:hypothetical protein